MELVYLTEDNAGLVNLSWLYEEVTFPFVTFKTIIMEYLN